MARISFGTGSIRIDPRNRAARVSYDLDASVPGAVLLVDRCLPGTMTITNAAEVVIAELAAAGLLAGRQVFYRDTEGRWDELLHDGGAFLGFKPWSTLTADGALIMAGLLKEPRWAKEADRA